ncbi:phenylacetate--CoA ligase family protein [Dokdonia sinensis]|uniref:Phenylacetate--CoA ligase family protein n=1 Tax=Dokdonia sinensis TaxID=2479847 RepID=A0A3M0FZ68_9FLAO|nr:phenylacetate--CoA ligase family protein [Dokdonia sinensis]RMB57964.1 phenylacetate--CoA ligase family protein [Dokdonia sinensis]
MGLFNWTLQLKGYDIAFAKAELSRIQSIPASEYPDYIAKKKAEIVAYHKKHNPFYKKRAAHLSDLDWNDLPVLTKSDLQQPLTQRLSKGFTPKNVYVNKTSGSSGHPFVFAKDKFSHALSWASFMDRYDWYDLDVNRSRQARFYGIPLDFVGYRKERLKDWIGKRYRFPVFDLSDEKLAGVLKKFETTPFDYLNGYTSSIVLFAKFLKQKNNILKEVCPSLKACIVTSEMLFDSDKQLMEAQFGIPIINEYGASELGLIAFQNREGHFQVDSELLFVEILDDNNQPVPDGTAGNIVVTSLYNKAHPFIRYAIGDIGTLSQKENLKYPVLEKLIGRTNDIARLPSGKVVPGLTFYYVTKSVIEEDGNVSEFVIEQTAMDTFKIIYKAKRKLNAAEENAIIKATYTYLEDDLNIIFEKVDLMDRSNRGKLKQFVSKI